MTRFATFGLLALGFGLSACGTSTGTNTMSVADTDAFCKYAITVSGEPMARCHAKQDKRNERTRAANANRIEGLALLNTPPAPAAAQIAADCKEGGQRPCPPQPDVTGSVSPEARSPAKSGSSAPE